MLNIDWFKPCKHVEYSIGAIYLTIMNLPRNVRFKQENVLLVGLLPGPREPKRDINAFLDPLVQELLAFWNGAGIETPFLKKRPFDVLYFALLAIYQHPERFVVFWDMLLFKDAQNA